MNDPKDTTEPTGAGTEAARSKPAAPPSAPPPGPPPSDSPGAPTLEMPNGDPAGRVSESVSGSVSESVSESASVNVADRVSESAATGSTAPDAPPPGSSIAGFTGPFAVLLALLLGLGAGAFISAPPGGTMVATSPAKKPGSGRMAGHHHGAPHPAKKAEGGDDKGGKRTLWTCSMHPQIKRSGPGKCPICGMDLVPVEAGSGGVPHVTMTPASRALARIQTTKVRRQDAEVELRMVGKVTYDETRVARLTAWFGGRIERLFVDFTGTVVKKGDHMLSIYSPELLVAQQELIQAAHDRKAAAGLLQAAARATYRAARDKLRLWGLQEWQIRKVERRGRPIEKITIFAPMGGIVTHKAALEGAWVKEGTPVYTIADLTHVWIELDAYESDIAWLRYGQQVRVTVDAFPGQPFDGRIAFVNPVLDEHTRTIKVRLSVANKDLRLKPGMFVHAVARVPVSGAAVRGAEGLAGKYICPMHPGVAADKPGRCHICGMRLVPAEKHWLVGPALRHEHVHPPLVIPASAPLITGKRVVVFVERPDAEDPTYDVREIDLGPRAGNLYVVSSGLKEGERVVTRGAFRLDSSMQISGEPSIMNPPETDANAVGGASGAAGKGTADKADKEVCGHLQHVRHALHKGDMEQVREGTAALAKAAAQLEDTRGIVEAVAALQRAEDLEAVGRALPDAIAVARAEIPACKGLPEQPTVRARGTGKAFLGALSDAVAATNALSRALAADDAAAARTAAAGLVKAAEALGKGEHAIGPALLRAARAGTTGADLGAERKTLAAVTRALVPLLVLHDAALPTRYEQFFCPMAFDGKGAPWLQAPGDTANPYFGQAMLGCGSKVGGNGVGAKGVGAKGVGAKGVGAKGVGAKGVGANAAGK